MKIETLLEKYFEARTTLGEEEALREYFENENIPDRWKQYQPLFRHFTAERDNGKVISMNLPAKNNRKSAYGWMAAAAAAAILLLTVLPLMTDSEEKSLAYIDGRKTADLTVISREAVRGLDSFASGNDDAIASQVEALNIFDD